MFKNILILFCFISVMTAGTSYPQNLTDKDKQLLLKYVSGSIDKELGSLRKNLKLPSLTPAIEKLTTPITIFLFNEQGDEGASYKVADEDLNLTQKIAVAVKVVCEKWRHQPISLSIPAPYVHIMLITSTYEIQNYGDVIFKNKIYEPKVTGIVFENNVKSEDISPLDAITHDIGPIQAKNYLCQFMNFPPQQLRFEKNIKIQIYKVDHFGERYPDRKYESFFRGHKIFRENDVNHDSIMDSIRIISSWFKNNIDANNQPIYAFADKTEYKPAKKQNIVRIANGVWTINKTASFLKDPDLKKIGENCIQQQMNKYFDTDKSIKEKKLIPLDRSNIKGQNILNRPSLAGFILLSMLENTAKYEKEINLITPWLMAHQTPSGKIDTPFAEDQFLTPGQLLLAVVGLYSKMPDEKVMLFLKKSAEYYLKEFSSLLDLGPKNFAILSPHWFSQYFTEIYFLTGDKRYRDFVYKLNDRVLNRYKNCLNKSSYFDYEGAIVPKAEYYGNSKTTAAGAQALLEGWRIAKRDNDQKKMAIYKKAIMRACAYLMRLQYRKENLYYIKEKEKILGGIKYDLIRGKIFLDNVSHTANLFMKMIQYKVLED